MHGGSGAGKTTIRGVLGVHRFVAEALRLEWWEPDRLEPNPLNWRRHPEGQVQAYRSLRAEVGWAGALLFNEETGRLVDGHLRREEALASGEPVPVLVGTWSEAQERLILAALDPIAAIAEADQDTLAKLLEQVESERPGLQALIEQLEREAGMRPQEKTRNCDADARNAELERLRTKWGTERGQVWQIGRHRLMCGDSRDREQTARLLNGEAPWIGLTSPPYWVGKEYEDATTFPQHLNLLQALYQVAHEFVDPNGFLFVNFGDIAPQSMTKGLTGVDGQCIYLMASHHYQLGRESGWALHSARVWLKAFSRLQRPFWTYKTSIPHHQEYEHLWTWVKDEAALHCTVPDDWAYAWSWRKVGADKDRRYDWDVSSRAVWDTRHEMTDDRPLTRHVAAFPLGIPERALKAHTSVGAIVWEPFCGSGTTIVACERLGRTCRAMELSPLYCAGVLEDMSALGLNLELVN